MTKVYLLFYDTDTGTTEEWDVCCTPCEVFTNPEDREKRIEYIKKFAKQSNNNYYEYEFYKNEVDVMNENTLQDNPF